VRGLLALLLATISAVWAQGPVGTLNGTVLDPAGLAVPGASVVATNRATGEEHKTTSTSAGAYTLPYVPPFGRASASVFGGQERCPASTTSSD
jgi:hypothetical protein